MATSMSSVFAGADRRKKVVTYGRAPRFGNAQIFTEDTPSSPEHPRKQAGGLPSPAQEPGVASRPRDAFRAPPRSPEPRDPFDVPSDTEPTPRAIPTRKLPPKSKPIATPTSDFDAWDVPSSGDEKAVARPDKSRAAPPTRKLTATRPKMPAQKTKTHERKPTAVASSNNSSTAAKPTSRARSKTPALAPPVARNATAKHKATDAIATSRPTATHSHPVVREADTKSVSNATIRKAVPVSLNDPSSEFAVFDVPSDTDAPTRTSVKSRKASGIRSKAPSKPPKSRAPPSPEPSADSDTSNASHKRKRRGSASSSSTLKLANATQTEDSSTSRRNRKYQRVEEAIAPSHTVNDPVYSTSAVPTQDHVTHKPKRTRIRTVPVVSRQPVSKSQSSPVKLHSMLAVRSATTSSPSREKLEASVAEDETMYDIAEEISKPTQDVDPQTPGSVTPRQRSLFSNLLSDAADTTTPMPSISKLHIANGTPGSALAALTRSSSDIPQSLHSRQKKLIDMLKGAGPSAEEESESDYSSEEDVVEDRTLPVTVQTGDPPASREAAGIMDIDQDAQLSSQISQPAILKRDTSRTYGNTRSYMEESNLEDGLLNWNEDIELDIDDRHGSVTGSEDDSQQVTGLPELRRKGQLYKFEAETLAMIEDISGRDSANVSARRSAMMEFASQMANDSFVSQLLESAMTSALLRAIVATGDVIFDFAAAAAVVFILRTRPSYAVVQQVYQSDVLSTLTKLLSSPMSSFDICRIAKDRKTNMSVSAREMVGEFRTLVLKTLDWPAEDTPKVSPQLLAIKVLEMLAIGLRTPGNTDPIADERLIGKVLDVASSPSQRLPTGKATAQDELILETAFSALESLSISKEEQVSWPDEVLGRLASMMSCFFETDQAAPRRLAIRLCMNVANGRPKACQIFADETFVQRLTRFIVGCFKQLGGSTGQHARAGMRDDLILALGAMMNLAEFSDKARLSVVQGGDGLIKDLVEIFLDGSERAEQVDSVEESQYLVPVGYLTMMLGNLCLNDRVRRKVTGLLPGNEIGILVHKVKEFVQYNQRLDQAEFEGAEGQQMLQNFTLRLMLVVERLEKAV